MESPPLSAKSSFNFNDVVLRDSHFVCKNLADADQAARLVAHGDAAAFTAFTAAKQREDMPRYGSACRYEDAGERLTVSDSAQGSVVGLECVRPSGHEVC